MKVLLISPVWLPYTDTSRYTGIEQLVWSYASELSAQKQEVSVVAHKLSTFPTGIEHLKADSYADNTMAELQAYRSYQHKLRDFDIVHDFSHLHLACRYNGNLPALNIFWHAPALAKYPKASYNIIAPSLWAAREFERVYRQKALYHNVIAIRPDIYHPSPIRSGRFLTIGRMSPEKGNLNAIRLCQKAGVPLDVCGGRGAEKTVNDPLTDYEVVVQGLCDGREFKFWGEVSDDQKVKLMQSCKALIYATTHPEVTGHKHIEVMMCGRPVIVSAIGSMLESVEHGKTGFLCRNEADFLKAIANVDTIKDTIDFSFYSLKDAIANWLVLYQEVKEGRRW